MPDAAAEAVASVAADPASAVIALDFDGTLAPIVANPADSRLAAGALEVLRGLAAEVGALAFVSGRGAEELVRLGGLDRIAGVQVLGHYGLQRWHDGRLRTPPPDPAVDVVRGRLPALLADAPPGVYVEDKHHSLAVHTRPAASPQAALDAVAPALRRLARDVGLEAVPGRFVLELRPPGIDKGTVVRDLVAETRARTVIYVGDDVGDLPAFRAVSDLRESGVIVGLAVFAGGVPESDESPGGAASDSTSEVPPELWQQADLVLAGPDAVVAWLAGILAQLR